MSNTTNENGKKAVSFSTVKLPVIKAVLKIFKEKLEITFQDDKRTSALVTDKTEVWALLTPIGGIRHLKKANYGKSSGSRQPAWRTRVFRLINFAAESRYTPHLRGIWISSYMNSELPPKETKIIPGTRDAKLVENLRLINEAFMLMHGEEPDTENYTAGDGFAHKAITEGSTVALQILYGPAEVIDTKAVAEIDDAIDEEE